MIDHCALETYSVLTRRPPPHRCAAAVVRDFPKARFVEPYLRLDRRAASVYESYGVRATFIG
jgi:hypothetical protein